jgi:hypothetical protein
MERTTGAWFSLTSLNPDRRVRADSTEFIEACEKLCCDEARCTYYSLSREGACHRNGGDPHKAPRAGHSVLGAISGYNTELAKALPEEDGELAELMDEITALDDTFKSKGAAAKPPASSVKDGNYLHTDTQIWLVAEGKARNIPSSKILWALGYDPRNSTVIRLGNDNASTTTFAHGLAAADPSPPSKHVLIDVAAALTSQHFFEFAGRFGIGSSASYSLWLWLWPPPAVQTKVQKEARVIMHSDYRPHEHVSPAICADMGIKPGHFYFALTATPTSMTGGFSKSRYCHSNV